MNICLISQELPPDTGWGGIGTYTYSISHGLVELGHHVDVISRAVKQDGIQKMYAGQLCIYRTWPKNYHLLRKKPWRFLSFYSHFPSVLDRPLGWGYAAYKTLRKLFQEKHIDIIEVAEHNADGFIYVLSNLLRTKSLNSRTSLPKLVVKLHMPMWHHCQMNSIVITPEIKLFNFLERFTTCQAQAITSPSLSLAKVVSKNWNIELDRMKILPNPIDDTLFRPAPSTGQDRDMILFVGRLEPRKGVDILIEAFKNVTQHCPQAILVLVGSDYLATIDGKRCSFRNYLQQELQDAQLSSFVQFVGKIDREQLPHYYQQSSICIVPSRFDNLPYTCLEAMACGKSVIASNIGGIPEIIEDGKNGILVPPDDPKRLGEAIIHLLNNKSIAEQMGKEARRKIETKYSIKAATYQTEQFYRSLL